MPKNLWLVLVFPNYRINVLCQLFVSVLLRLHLKRSFLRSQANSPVVSLGDARAAESKIVHAMALFMMIYLKVPGNPFSGRTRAAMAPMGARIMQQLSVSPSKKLGAGP